MGRDAGAVRSAGAGSGGRVRRSPAAALAAGLLGVATAAHAGVALPVGLARAAADYDRAQIDGDRSALKRLLATDYRLVNSRGEVESRAQFIAESSDPAFKLNPFVVTRPTTVVWTDGAVLAGEVRLTGTSAGTAFAAHLRFADIWARRAGRWQVVFTQVTPASSGPTKRK